MQDGGIAERVNEARQAAGVAVDVGLGIIGEDGDGMAAAAGVVVDVIAGLRQGHGRHVIGDADALADGGEGSVLEQFAHFGVRIPVKQPPIPEIKSHLGVVRTCASEYSEVALFTGIRIRYQLSIPLLEASTWMRYWFLPTKWLDWKSTCY